MAQVHLDGSTLTLSGDIDTATVAGWRAGVPQLPPVGTVDSRAVTFFDLAGLGLLLQLAEQAGPGLVTLRVRGPHVVRVLDLTGTTRLFRLEEDDPAGPGRP